MLIKNMINRKIPSHLINDKQIVFIDPEGDNEIYFFLVPLDIYSSLFPNNFEIIDGETFNRRSEISDLEDWEDEAECVFSFDEVLSNSVDGIVLIDCEEYFNSNYDMLSGINDEGEEYEEEEEDYEESDEKKELFFILKVALDRVKEFNKKYPDKRYNALNRNLKKIINILLEELSPEE